MKHDCLGSSCCSLMFRSAISSRATRWHVPGQKLQLSKSTEKKVIAYAGQCSAGSELVQQHCHPHFETQQLPRSHSQILGEHWLSLCELACKFRFSLCRRSSCLLLEFDSCWAWLSLLCNCCCCPPSCLSCSSPASFACASLPNSSWRLCSTDYAMQCLRYIVQHFGKQLIYITAGDVTAACALASGMFEQFQHASRCSSALPVTFLMLAHVQR